MALLDGDVLSVVAAHLGAEETCRRMVRVSKAWRSSLIGAQRLWLDFTTAASLQATGPYAHLTFLDHPFLDHPSNPPWRRGRGPSFADGLNPLAPLAPDQKRAEQKHIDPDLEDATASWVGGENGVGSWYELWRRYALAEEEHELEVVPFLARCKDVGDSVARFRRRIRVVEKMVLPILLWLSALAQLALSALRLSSASAEISLGETPLGEILYGWWVAPAGAAAAICGVWWWLNAGPLIYRWRLKHTQMERLRRRKSFRFYERAAPPGTLGAQLWPQPVLEILATESLATENLASSRGLMRSLEAWLMILLSVCLLGRGDVQSDEIWWISMPAAFGLLWLAFNVAKRDDSEQQSSMVPFSRATVGYGTATIGLFALSIVAKWRSLLPLVIPYTISSAALWLHASKRWAEENRCGHCLICCFLCSADPTDGPCDLVRAIGVVTLWLSGIMAIVRADMLLFAHAMAEQLWPRWLVWPLILSPLAFNLALLLPHKTP